MWALHDTEINWRDETGAEVVRADSPEAELTTADHLLDAWAASGLPFVDFLATLKIPAVRA
ncbi:MAG: hypothetical protein AB7K08_05360 [Microbacteriaceae bacterium]